MDNFYYDRWMEATEKVGASSFHIGKLLEIIERSVDTSEMSVYYKTDCEIAVANAKQYLEDRNREFDNARESLNKTLERLQAREVT